MKSAILIYGRGKVGQSLVRFCVSIDQPYIICDDSDAPESFDEFLTIIPSPGVPASHRIYTTGKVISELDFLLPYLPKDFHIHAVTGTDGKSTTAWILYHFLKGSFIDLPVYLGGNFDIPFSDIIREIREKGETLGHIVLEVSSFMAYHLEAFPFSDTTILTNLHPDHLDWHSDVDQYYKSKINLLGHTKNLILYPASILTNFPEITDFPLESIVLPESIEIQDNLMLMSPGIMLDTSERQLFGDHNLRNIFFAAALLLTMGVSIKTLSSILPNITALPHRLQKVSDHGGRVWIDDSKSTTAQSLYAALGAFSPQKVYLIAGGKDKGDQFIGLSEQLLTHATGVTALGETKHTFLQGAHDAFLPGVTAVDMSEAVDQAFANTREGDIILLSPGCSSLDMFQNYEDRAGQYILKINSLA